ncbi:MaoC family dehydratase N-terminal domain-containing protein [Alcaligenaceae bacterium CGII-47]|nr:MaoC family dehydratase N-terminal domain-containing protein [Alcaligenaceae bacterium CGII-47]
MSTLLPAHAVGVELPAVEVEFTTRRLMSYAAALGATEDVYLNDMHPGGIIGLPTFIVSPEWQVMNGEPYRALLGADDACMWRCIHVQQDSRVFQPIRPGQSARTQGTVCALRQTRIGVYVAVRLDTTLRDTGTLIAQSWFCGIFLGDQTDGPEHASIAEPPALAVDESTAGFSMITKPVLVVTRALPHLYTEAAAIWNPIHTERSAARQAGLNDTLLHGTCTWGAAGLQIIRHFGQGDPARLLRLGARMTGKALVGASLYLRYKVMPTDTSNAECISFQIVDEAGSPILSNGIAEIAPVASGGRVL